LADGVVEGEKLSDDTLIDYTNILPVVEVGRGEKPAHNEVNGRGFEMPGDGADDLDGDFTVSIPGLLCDSADGDDNLDVGDTGAKSLGVIVSQAVFLQGLLLACNVLVFGGLDGLDDDVE
jgi:hypothetical protein